MPIAREAGCSSSTVARRLAEHGLEAVGKAEHAPRGDADLRWLPVLVDARFSIREIGIALGLSYTATRSH